MISLKARSLTDIQNEVTTRGTKHAMVLDSQDYTQCIKRSIRVLNEIIHNPRHIMQAQPGPKLDLTPFNVDEIVKVMFSNESFFNKFLPEVGLLPLLFSSAKLVNLDSLVDYLVLKGSLNIMSRQMRTAPDYEYYPPYLQFNGIYQAVMIEYLPYLDPEVDSWDMYENEYRFFLEYCWADIQVTNAEAIYSGSTLGVNKEIKDVLEYWATKKKDLFDQFVASAVIDYVG